MRGAVPSLVGIARLVVVALVVSVPAAAQTPSAPPYPDRLDIRPFAVVGATWFTADQTFDAVLDTRRGVEVGGGVSFTQGPAFIELGARRFSKTGSRVFVSEAGEVFPLGIPATVTMTPFDVSLGWRFRPLLGRVRPHLGGGYTRLRYQETSDFAADDENVDAWFNGYHVLGGAEVRLARWVGLTGEVVWTSVRNALGAGGASQAFDEHDLGGTSLRLKLVIGR